MERTNSAGKKKKKSKSEDRGSGYGQRVTGRKSMRNNYLDDDDFSVAPSMDQDVKSVVSVSFDDVYKRGRKVCIDTSRMDPGWMSDDNDHDDDDRNANNRTVLSLTIAFFLSLSLQCVVFIVFIIIAWFGSFCRCFYRDTQTDRSRIRSQTN